MAVILGVGYKDTYDKIPATIRLKAGVEQTLNWKLPVYGRIVKVQGERAAVAVDGQSRSNIPQDAIYIDLSSAVTVKADTLDEYRMDLKLFGWIPLKQVDIQVIQDTMLRPVGMPIGIYVKTDGILVIGVGDFEGKSGKIQAPAKYLLKTGDYILKVNGKEVSGKKEFMKMVEECEGRELILTIRRGKKYLICRYSPYKIRTENTKLEFG